MNEYQKKYKEQSIMQMSQGELLILTFDEAIKCLKQADLALGEKNYKIIHYLRKTLDMKQEISRDLMELYDFITFDIGLVKAGRERRQEELPKLADILNDLREGFYGASQKVTDVHMPEEAKVVG